MIVYSCLSLTFPCMRWIWIFQELDLAGNQLGDLATAQLADALAALPNLQVLQLQDNYNLGVEGVAALAGRLSALPALTALHLNKATPGAEGARLLSQVKHVEG